MRRPTVLAGLLLTWFGPSLGFAQIVVLRAEGPTAAQHPTGTILGVGSVLRLTAKDRVEIIDNAGTRELEGPGVVTVDSPSPHARDRWRQLVSVRDRGSIVAGVRGDPKRRPPSPPNAWWIDVDVGGQMCVNDDAPLQLWRRDRTATWDVAISDPPTAATRRLVHAQWRAGADTVAWPRELPVDDGRRYEIDTEQGPPIIVTWRKVKAETDLPSLAASLLNAGCRTQFDALQTALDKAALR